MLSVHKTLTGFTQSALVLARGQRIDLEALDAAFELGHTTSPSAAILRASTVPAALIEERGPELIGRALELATWAREQLAAVPGVTVFSGGAGYGHDPLKLVVSVAGAGANGFAVDDDLLRAGVRLEMADRDTLVPILTVADDRRSVERLVAAMTAAIERHRGDRPRPVGSSAVWRLRTEAVLPPREAHFARHERVPADRGGRAHQRRDRRPLSARDPGHLPGRADHDRTRAGATFGGGRRHPHGLLRGCHARDAGRRYGVTAV